MIINIKRLASEPIRGGNPPSFITFKKLYKLLIMSITVTENVI